VSPTNGVGQPGSAGNLYGRKRQLTNQIQADRDHLENAPLGPIQRKRLAAWIVQCETELVEVKQAIKARRETK
jgi:hypothetical protein